MGVSQSRDVEEYAGVGRTKKAINNNSTSERSDANCASTSSMSSTNRRLRIILPKRRSNNNQAKKTDSENNETSSAASKANHSSATVNNSSATSPIVASFMTNISSRYNTSCCNVVANNDYNKSYPYPRAHATNLVPIGVNVSSTAPDSSNNSNSDQESGLRWPVSSSYKKRQAQRQRMAMALDIPSPVPSVSEPSEDNFSLEDEREQTSDSENETRSKNQNAMQQNIGSAAERQHNRVTILDTVDIFQISNTVATAQPGKSELSTTTTTMAKNSILKQEKSKAYPSVVVSGIPKKQQIETNVVRSQSLMEKGISGSKIADDSTTTLTNENQTKRPTTLSASTNKIPTSRSAWAKLCVGIAPLAESECFVIENSPAVELPPGGRLGKNGSKPVPPSPLSSIYSEEKDSGYVEEKEKEKKEDTWTTTTTASRLQSRLKNPSTYASRQRVIYNRHANPSTRSATVTSGSKEEVKENADSADSASTSLVINTSTENSDRVSPTILQKSETPNFSPMAILKRELRDSGVRMDSIGGSSSDAIGVGVYGGSKTSGSPEGSLYRGLIDDEIRDQPDLMIGDASAERHDQGRSRASTLKEEILEKEVIGESGGGGGPVRVKDKIRRRSTRMNESYESAVSSLSIDSEDMMLDFDLSTDLLGEETDAVNAFDNVSTYSSSLGRRSSRNSASGTGSWGRRKAKSLAASGKRPSLEAVVDEWESLKGEIEKGPHVQTQRQRALSDLPPSCSRPASSSGRILKPPVSLESTGLPSMGLEQQTYRHVVQDVTVMKTLLLRLKRVLQESETSNPFENSMNVANGLSKFALVDSDVQKPDGGNSQMTNEVLKQENSALRSQVVFMLQQMEDQNCVIQCLQHQLKQCRQRNLSNRKSDSSATDENLPREIGVRSSVDEEQNLANAGMVR